METLGGKRVPRGVWRPRVVGAFFLALACSGTAHGAASAPVPWGLPLDGGSIRVLFIAPQYTMRDATELASRLDLDVERVALWDARHLGRDDPAPANSLSTATSKEVKDFLRKRLKKSWDVIVAGNFDFSILPQDVLAAIIQKVRRGTGLVLAYHRDNAPQAFEAFLDSLTPAEDGSAVTRGVDESLLPELLRGRAAVRTSTFGSGRVAELLYTTPRPKMHFLLPALGGPLPVEAEGFETYFSLAARAVLWAAHRDSTTWIESVEVVKPAEPDEREIPPELSAESLRQMRQLAFPLPYRTYILRLNRPAQRSYRVKTQVRMAGRRQPAPAVHNTLLRKGDTTYSVAVRAAPGWHVLDLWLLDPSAEEDQVVEWRSVGISMEGWPEFSEVRFSKNELRPHDTLDVYLRIPPASYSVMSCTVQARVMDSCDRVLAERHTKVSARGGTVSLSLEVTDLLSPWAKAEVYAVLGDMSQIPDQVRAWAAYAGSWMPVRRLVAENPFAFVVRPTDFTEYNARFFNRMLADLGADTACFSDLQAALVPSSALDFQPIAHISEYGASAMLRSLNRDGQAAPIPWLGDPGFWNSERPRLEQTAGLLKSRQAMYLLSDGGDLSGYDDLCESPESLAGYRKSLQVQYGALGILNSAWGTRFTAWDEVRPAPEEAARILGVYAPWLDFRRYLDARYCEALGRGRDIIRAVHRDARVGFRANPGTAIRQGYDWPRLASNLDVLGIPPDKLLVEKVRSFSGPAVYAGIVLGTEGAAPTAAWARWFPWYAVLHDLPSVWWWDIYGDCDHVPRHPGLGPDGILPELQELAREITAVNAGLADVLLRGKRHHCGIAIYSSEASRYLNYLESSFGTGTGQAETAFIELLESLGYQYDFVSEDAAKQGKLGEYRLLLLPMIRALSRDEVSAIRTFCEGGGWVVADLLPGQFDEHGLPRQSSSLDAVFGVARRADPAAPIRIAEAPVRISEGTSEVYAVLKDVICDGGVNPAGATVCGEGLTAPVWLLRGNGTGTALLLNHTVPAREDGKQDAALRKLFAAVLRLAEVKPVAYVTVGNGGFDGECIGYRYGAAEVIALLRNPGPEKDVRKATLRLDRADGMVYDLRAGQPVLRTRNLVVRLPAGGAAVYARLPYEVTELIVEAPPRIRAGDRLPVHVTLKATRGLAGEHVVRIDFIPLGGAPLRHYAKNVVCPKGEGHTFVPLALNEQPGFYHVAARDVLSGAENTATVRVTPSQ